MTNLIQILTLFLFCFIDCGCIPSPAAEKKRRQRQNLIIFYLHCLRDYQKLQTKTKSLINISGMKKKYASIASSMRQLQLHCLQHRFPYPYLQIYSTRDLKSIQCWNQRLKYYSSSIFKWRQNQMTFTFFLEILPYTP